MIEEYTKELTEMSGADYEIEYSSYCPPVINNQELVEDFTSCGDTSVVHELEEPSMGSEDFPFHMQDYVGPAFRISTKMKNVEASGYSLHSPEDRTSTHLNASHVSI